MRNGPGGLLMGVVVTTPPKEGRQRHNHAHPQRAEGRQRHNHAHPQRAEGRQRHNHAHPQRAEGRSVA
jgi:hypothetical protein